MPVNLLTVKRYHGVSVRYRSQECRMGRKLKMAGWLTFLDASMVEDAGGASVLREKIGDLLVSEPRGCMLFRTGETAPVADVNRQDEQLDVLRRANQALAAVRLDKWFSFNLLCESRDEADAWFRRFDP